MYTRYLVILDKNVLCNNTFVLVKDPPQPLAHPVSWVEVVAEALWQMKFFSADHHYNAKISFSVIYFLKF